GCRPDTGHVPLEEQDLTQGSDWGPAGARLQAFVDPDADQLTCSPAELVRYIRLLTFSGSHPEIADGAPLSPQTIVDVLLDGVLTPSARGTSGTCCTHAHTPAADPSSAPGHRTDTLEDR
ncbi:MAG: hypothetical protein ABIW80_10520, partial [Lapillicoccus sp.]